MFGMNLKKRRVSCGLSQKQVAEYLGLSPQSVSKWENGQAQPTIDYLPKLAECLCCQINDFFVPGEQAETEENDLIELFAVQTACIKGLDKTEEDLLQYALQHDGILDEGIAFCERLKLYKSLRAVDLQKILRSSADAADLMLDYLVQDELLKKLDDAGLYYVVADAVDGQIILWKLQKRLCRVMEEKS